MVAQCLRIVDTVFYWNLGIVKAMPQESGRCVIVHPFFQRQKLPQRICGIIDSSQSLERTMMSLFSGGDDRIGKHRSIRPHPARFDLFLGKNLFVVPQCGNRCCQMTASRGSAYRNPMRIDMPFLRMLPCDFKRTGDLPDLARIYTASMRSIVHHDCIEPGSSISHSQTLALPIFTYTMIATAGADHDCRTHILPGISAEDTSRHKRLEPVLVRVFC